MKAKEINPPDNILISKYFSQADYVDCFSLKLETFRTKNLQVYTRLFFTQWPKWVQSLFKLRNCLVSPFGLQASKDEMNELTHARFDFRTGGQVAFFHISEITEHEILLFVKDKHLDTWLSICIIPKGEQHELIASTVVKYNNFLGKAYFFFVKPFHKIIVRNQLNQMNLTKDRI